MQPGTGPGPGGLAAGFLPLCKAAVLCFGLLSQVLPDPGRTEGATSGASQADHDNSPQPR